MPALIQVAAPVQRPARLLREVRLPARRRRLPPVGRDGPGVQPEALRPRAGLTGHLGKARAAPPGPLPQNRRCLHSQKVGPVSSKGAAATAVVQQSTRRQRRRHPAGISAIHLPLTSTRFPASACACARLAARASLRAANAKGLTNMSMNRRQFLSSTAATAASATLMGLSARVPLPPARENQRRSHLRSFGWPGHLRQARDGRCASPPKRSTPRAVCSAGN